MAITIEQAHTIVIKHVDLWNKDPANIPLWVVLASPGDQIQIPEVTFGRPDLPRAGMHQLIHANLIVLRREMVPESLLATFFHEYGHAIYKKLHVADWNEIDSRSEE